MGGTDRERFKSNITPKHICLNTLKRIYFVKKNVSTLTTLVPTIAPVFAITDGNALKESLTA